MGQMWLDGSYWFPFPIPEFNDREQRLDYDPVSAGSERVDPDQVSVSVEARGRRLLRRAVRRIGLR